MTGRTAMRTTSLLLVAALAGCGGKDDPYPLTLVDANNYSLDVNITIPAVETASGSDLTIHWEDALEDLQCHEMDPAQDVNTVSVVRFGTLTQDNVSLGISEDTLKQSDTTGYVDVPTTGTTSTSLSAMSFFGTPIDVPSEYTTDAGTFLLILATGDTPGQGARMLTFLTPTADSTNTDVAVGSGCGMLDNTVDLHSLTTLAIPETGPWTVDWSGLTTDGQGNPIDLGGIDSLTVGYYEGLDAAGLETQFLDLEQLASNLYTQTLLGGTSAELDRTTNGSEWLTDVSGDGMWILALRCSTCYNPAPVFLTILDPQPVEK